LSKIFFLDNKTKGTDRIQWFVPFSFYSDYAKVDHFIQK